MPTYFESKQLVENAKRVAELLRAGVLPSLGKTSNPKKTSRRAKTFLESKELVDRARQAREELLARRAKT